VGEGLEVEDRIKLLPTFKVGKAGERKNHRIPECGNREALGNDQSERYPVARDKARGRA